MKERLMRLCPRARARLLRHLELASDDPLLKPEKRRRAEHLLCRVKAILKAQAMYVYRDRSPAWRVGHHTFRQWHRWFCHCGVEGSVLYEIDVRLWPENVIAVDVEGFLDLASDGKVVCRRCRYHARQNPAAQ